MKKVSLYIHIPYCKAKCRFCNFFVVAGRTPGLPSYFKTLKKEAMEYKANLADYSISTIYFGGGTPSLVDAELIADFIDFLKAEFNVSSKAEVTLEANPENISEHKMRIYRKSGINRLSIGLQAWQDDILKYTGRLYTIEQFLEKYKIAKRFFKNINIDLIFGIPGLKLSDWETTLNNVIKLKPKHISCYSLEVEEGSIFGQLMKRGMFTPVKDKLDRQMYKAAKRILKKAGYNHYEISNFAQKGFEAQHNVKIWEMGEYIGLGASAHSYFMGERYNNVYSIEKYIAGVLLNKEFKENIYKLDVKQQIIEYILLNMRLIKGLEFADFKKRYKKDFVKTFTSQLHNLGKQGLIRLTKERLILTPKGQDLENKVLMEFF